MRNDLNRLPAARRAFAGFTLVETMVALVIGLLATFIVMQVFAISEGQKRTIMGGADAQSDAAVVLYLIERDLRQAGYGLSPNPEDFDPAQYGAKGGGVLTSGILAKCTTVNAYKKDRATTTDFVYADSTFAPVVINPTGYPAGDAGTDVLLVNYGASDGMIGKGVLLTNQTGATTQTGGNVPDFVVNTDKGSRAGFMNGDLILAVPPPARRSRCTIAEITGLPRRRPTPAPAPVALPLATRPASHSINHNDVAYKNFYTGCDAATPRMPSGTRPGVASASRRQQAVQPGSAYRREFVSRVYAVRKGNLTVCDLTLNDCTAAVADPPDPAVWVPVANGVVGLRAQYGRDTNFNGIIDAWDATTHVGAARAQVAAVRLAVVVRSGQFEKEDVTAAAPVWHKDATPRRQHQPSILTGSGSDWQHFRYKTAQSIVPVRNLIWGQQN